MDEREKLRPGGSQNAAVRRERPQTPRQKPRPSRSRTGSASEQARARRERLQSRERETARRIDETDPEQALYPEDAVPEAAPELEPARERKRSPASRNAPENKKRKKKKKPHRIYNTNFGFKFLIMIAVVAVIVLSMVIFFKVKHIHVILQSETGGESEAPRSYYTREEIIEAAGISIDDNLLSVSKAGIASKIHAAFPYVNEVIVQKKLPGSVYITLTEFTVTYAIKDAVGDWWLISREGRVLEPADEQSISGHMQITGIPIRVPKVGDTIQPVTVEGADLNETSAKRSAVLALLPELEERPCAKKIVSVDVSSSFDIILWYGSQFEIKLGNTELLTDKLNMLESVLNKLGSDESGTIDMSFSEDQDVHFLPFR